jgi:hypothetical protein
MSDIPTSGTISLNQMHTEVGGASGSIVSINDADIRALISKGSGTTMSFTEWYGASSSIDTQTVTVGLYTVTFYGSVTNIYGYYFNGLRGSISDGTCNFKSGNTYQNLYHTTTGGGRTVLAVNQGYGGNSGFTTMSINGTNFSRASASFSQNSTKTQWLWTSPSTNGFGTTVGATKSVVFT